MPPRVYLTGFMATGKSTVGPLVADRLGYRFVDLDWLVEARARRTVAELFADGEAVFRAAEARALAETANGRGLVVATGGGTLVTPGNLVVAQRAGAVVWLRSSVAVTLRRLDAAQVRPLLAGADGRPLRGPALDERVRALSAAREPVYARADLVVDADGAADVVARQVAEGLRGWRRGPARPS